MLTYPLFQHPGTEFIYMLEGVMDYSHSRVKRCVCDW